MALLELTSVKEICELASSDNGVNVSIFVPTQRKGHEARQSAIHLKNLLRDIKDDLTGRGQLSEGIAYQLADAHELIVQDSFWQHQSEGLAIFLNADSSRMYKLPVPVEPRHCISESFDITPLIPMFSGDGHYYVLAVSQNDVRLFDATRFTFAEVSIEGIPGSMAEALWADDHERQLQWHSGAGAAPNRGGRSAMFYGTGDEGNMERHKVDYKRYFDKVDAALAPTFKKYPAPVVLAGVGYLLPIYRKANSCAEILEGEVHGNQDRNTEEAIHQASWEIARPHFEARTHSAIERFQELLGTGLASADQDEIMQAAAAGRVETLFVVQGVGGDDQQPINAATVQTLQKRGEIIALPQNAMPVESSMAATYRF